MRALKVMIAVMLGASALGIGCGDDRSEPLERVGTPLAVSPSTATKLDADQASDLSANDSSPALEADGSEPLASHNARSPETTPQPAKALTIAAEADVAAARGDLASARSSYSRAVELNPRSPWLRVALAWFQSRTDMLPQARDELERALDLVERPDPLVLAAIHHGFGELRESRRDWARARESYRMALRAWSSPPLARALLHVTPPTNDQRSAAEQLAFNGQKLPPQVLSTFAKRGGAEPLAIAEIPDRGIAVVTALPEPRPSPLPPGARYRVHIESASQQSDATTAQPPEKLLLGEAAAVRWHQAEARTVALGPSKNGILITVTRTAPGAGAPEEEWTSLAAIGPHGELAVIMERQTGAQRDDPLGCRRGWHEEVSVVETSLRVTREDFVRPRLPHAASFCTKRSRTKAPEVVSVEQP